MARRTAARKSQAKNSRRAKRHKGRRNSGLRIPKLWPGASRRRRWLRAFNSLPGVMQLIAGLALAAALAVALNWAYQVIRKPSELFFPISGTLYKTPFETWRSYGPIFRRHSTATMTPDFLAALAQVEGSGNPIVRTYWRWSLSNKPLDIYKPASSAVGMYQITDGTFAEARRYCIHKHIVIADGPWNDFKSCWLNGLYTRTVPSHAVEMTAAYLELHVTEVLRRQGIRRASLRQKQNLAALIHVCGAGAGRRYAARGLRLSGGQRCGDHDAAAYIAKVSAMQAVFRRLQDA
jgi:hypothetical protein